ncbi:MAG: Trk system potassium transporter TrkA [Saprospiraceae bacterium]|nr:Trk system potassium transporter TrkA [Saprospiraceae bacterium]
MKIVIAGAGDVGVHLAKLLASEQQDITLIDQNSEVLEHASSNLDVQTIRGDASSISILKSAAIDKARLFLAVTTSEKDNLIACILAKELGAGKTVARVNNQEFLQEESINLFKTLGVDHVISPIQLAAKEIVRLVEYQGVSDVFLFEEGKINLFGIFVGPESKLAGKLIGKLTEKYSDLNFNPIAVLRGRNTMLPEDVGRIRRNDHIYFLCDDEHRQALLNSLGVKKLAPKRIMIIGGSDMGRTSAKLLEEDYHVTIVEEDKSVCRDLVSYLEHSLVIRGNPGDIELLLEENLEKMDVFIALTPNSETNILTSLLASNYKVNNTIALVDNTDYTYISQNIGVDTLINKKLIAANNIFRFVRKGQIEAITSLHGVDAEIIEFVVHSRKNRLTKKTIKELKLPKGAVIGSVIRNQETLIPDGQFKFLPGDKVIVLALAEAIHRVEAIFR